MVIAFHFFNRSNSWQHCLSILVQVLTALIPPISDWTSLHCTSKGHIMYYLWNAHYTCHHLSSPAITCHHLQSPAITCHHLPSPAITCNHLPLTAITCHHLQSPAITCNHLPSPAITWHHADTLNKKSLLRWLTIKVYKNIAKWFFKYLYIVVYLVQSIYFALLKWTSTVLLKEHVQC